MPHLTMRDSQGESGRASLEFLVFGIGLVIPIMFLGMSLASIQGRPSQLRAPPRTLPGSLFSNQDYRMRQLLRTEPSSLLCATTALTPIPGWRDSANPHRVSHRERR